MVAARGMEVDQIQRVVFGLLVIGQSNQGWSDLEFKNEDCPLAQHDDIDPTTQPDQGILEHDAPSARAFCEGTLKDRDLGSPSAQLGIVIQVVRLNEAHREALHDCLCD